MLTGGILILPCLFMLRLAFYWKSLKDFAIFLPAISKGSQSVLWGEHVLSGWTCWSTETCRTKREITINQSSERPNHRLAFSQLAFNVDRKNNFIADESSRSLTGRQVPVREDYREELCSDKNKNERALEKKSWISVAVSVKAVLHCQAAAPAGAVNCIRPIRQGAVKWLAVLQDSRESRFRTHIRTENTFLVYVPQRKPSPRCRLTQTLVSSYIYSSMMPESIRLGNKLAAQTLQSVKIRGLIWLSP